MTISSSLRCKDAPLTLQIMENRIKHLRDEINRHNHNYYILNSPEISDKDYDMMMKELETLETQFPQFYDPLSPTQRVGSDLSKGFEHITHERPMLSLSNTYSIEEVDEWFDRVRKGLDGETFDITGEMKYDGTSISLTYENGRLLWAVTRGDGTQGDDVTRNVMTIRSIPLVLQPGDWPDKFEIRGEILMPWKVFDELNKEREYNEEPLFANPRNAASGTLKTQDPKEVARRRLDAVFYYLLADELPADNHFENLLAAKRWGFKVTGEIKILHSVEDVNDYINYWDTERKNLPVATDGLVFKVNSLRQQLNLGFTAKSPRWAVAYKFNPENACTPLKSISFETGRMGIVTPVANLEPVQLSGTIVKRASLHNADIIRELDIHEGDWLYVEKGGEIIPKITGVEISKRAAGAMPVNFVTKCPVCDTPLVKQQGDAAWCCPNKYGCRPQITGRIEHFCARRMMNIDGIGEETAELLYDKGLATTYADLYDLTADKLEVLERFGEKSAERILKGLQDSKQVPFERVIYALSIPNVGETTAKRVAKTIKSMESLMAVSVEELQAIPDVGPVVAQCIFDFMHERTNIDNITRLSDAGLQMQLSEDKMNRIGNALEGKSIVISGTFSHHSREEYKEMIDANGGKNVGSISKKTSFVLAGDNMGPSKLEKCEKLGIPIITEDEFLTMLS